jgi:hypothetical protein
VDPETTEVLIPWSRGNRILGYDPELRRVWIGGQRLHHGITGIALAGAGLVHLGWRRRLRRRRALAWTMAGGALIAHDWKDRAAWFRRGAQIS